MERSRSLTGELTTANSIVLSLACKVWQELPDGGYPSYVFSSFRVVGAFSSVVLSVEAYICLSA